MIDAIHQTLDKIATEPRSLRTFVAEHALETHDPDFFFNLDRFPEGHETLPFLAEVESCRRFFDSRYEDITAVLIDMDAA